MRENERERKREETPVLLLVYNISQLASGFCVAREKKR